MEYIIRGDHFEVTEALKDYTQKKIKKLERFFNTPLDEANVTLSVVKNKHVVEVMIPLSGVMLRAEERSEDMYASIDKVLDKLERQVRKYKTKINRQFRQDRGKGALIKENFDNINSRAAEQAIEEDDELELVRTKRFTLKPMDIEEAILQMNMIGHDFFVFSNAVSNQVNVVYKRQDGKYGLIEPAI
ncbi:ribosome hibernation-promoting factor, HPF/YfiA family [Paenibacillus turpanensis]|uniref:ribosome hibernation-promoting factor, HPF/YfiA family n=1 Tax=Paenibacillus turpanensis TaxID=2689078 RepID=UPI0014079C1B|nr:ribosome-associated translation inhibitor RaiA [Paenibacillus turpanensis]